MISAIIMICWFALYQIGQNVRAAGSGSILSISTGVVTYTWTSFSAFVQFQSPSVSGDLATIYISTGNNSWNVGTFFSGVTLDNPMAGWAPWTPTITFTGFASYTWTNAYLHVFITSSTWTNTWYLMQTITFIPNWWGGWPDRWAIYTTIWASLSWQWILNNMNTVTSWNASSFSWLYFAKMSWSSELGRIAFATGLDLTDTWTQNFLSGELPASIGMDQWQMRFNPGTGFIGKNATLTMNIPYILSGYLATINSWSFAVRVSSWWAVTWNSMISSVTYGACIGTWNFSCPLYINVAHFTQFDIKPFLLSAHITSNNANTSYAKTWDVVTLSFTWSETLSGVTVTINWISKTAVWWWSARSATGLVTWQNTAVTFTIDYLDAFNNTWVTVTSTTDSSSVTMDNTTPVLSWAAAVTNTTSQTPSYSFTSNDPWTIAYSWWCTSSTTTAISGTNNIIFSALANGTYSTCKLQVTNYAGITSSGRLAIPSFTVSYTAPSGGGWGGLIKDSCPSGDNSPSLYDKKCEASWSSTWALHWQAIRYTWSIRWSRYSTELNDAYLYSRGIGITTINSIQDADIEGNLIRAHMAKMMVNYAIKVLKKTPNTWANCVFDDIADQSTEMKLYIRLACQLGLMGVGINDFNPNGEVTRAEFGTVLSRALYGDANNAEGGMYYIKHLNALKANNIITNINPWLKEIRGYVMLMLMRAK